MIKSIGLIVKEKSEPMELAGKIIEFLKDRGVQIQFGPFIAGALNKEMKEVHELDPEILIVMGGDGMILYTASHADPEIPILGINFGTMGFLTETDPGNWKQDLEKLLDGDYFIESRDKLAVLKDGVPIGEAVNEAVVVTSSPVKMVELELFLDDVYMDSVRCDGIIVATPTGSTAYSMSSGGPIVDPRVKGFVVTPISPFKSKVKSYVIPQDSKLKIRLKKTKRDAYIVLDGHEPIGIKEEDEVIFRAGENKLKLVKFHKDFYNHIRELL